jgi:DNA invertase Pin-like site-specific DNA recombinase
MEGWHLVEERFDDDGFLGGTLDRPALTRLRDLVRKREVDAVVIHRMDRLARSLLGSATLLVSTS